MNVVDSCGWLEFLADGPNAAFFEAAITATDELIVPSITLYEVFKRVLQQRGETAALASVALMMQGQVVAFDGPLALEAARTAVRDGLALADSGILATARAHAAVLWTQDSDFAGIAGVRFVPRGP